MAILILMREQVTIQRAVTMQDLIVVIFEYEFRIEQSR